MSRAKVTDADLIDFLIATPRQATATEAARTQPAGSPDPAAHDAYTRLLHRLEPDAEALWAEVATDVRLASGMLVVDDSVLDKPYARKVGLVHRQWSGKHHGVVKGIGLVTLLWTDGDRHLPCDYRAYDKAADGKTKNDHFGDLLAAAAARGFQPECVLWYSGLANLKRCRELKWRWLTRFRSNRLVNPDRAGPRPVSACEIAATGTVVHLPSYGVVKVFSPRGHGRHGGLGHGRPGHGRPRTAPAVGRELADRGVPPGPQADDQRRAVPVPGGPGPAEPCRPGPAGVRRPRAVLLPDRRELADGQVADHPRGRPRLPGKPGLQNRHCATPNRCKSGVDSLVSAGKRVLIPSGRRLPRIGSPPSLSTRRPFFMRRWNARRGLVNSTFIALPVSASVGEVWQRDRSLEELHVGHVAVPAAGCGHQQVVAAAAVHLLDGAVERVAAAGGDLGGRAAGLGPVWYTVSGAAAVE